VLSLGRFQLVVAGQQRTTGVAELVNSLPERFVSSAATFLDVGHGGAVVVDNLGEFALLHLGGLAEVRQAFAQRTT
jgi:hypothetical protein